MLNLYLLCSRPYAPRIESGKQTKPGLCLPGLHRPVNDLNDRDTEVLWKQKGEKESAKRRGRHLLKWDISDES